MDRSIPYPPPSAWIVPSSNTCSATAGSFPNRAFSRPRIAAMPRVPAVRDGRVRILTEPYGQVPGQRIADLAEAMGRALRGGEATRATRAGNRSDQ